MDKSDEFFKFYSKCLDGLTVDSRYVIENLTQIAIANSNNSVSVVEAITHSFYSTHPEHGILLLYLIDSIFRKGGDEYRRLLIPMIVDLFTHVYSSCSNQGRSDLTHLYRGWRTIVPPRVYDQIHNYAKEINMPLKDTRNRLDDLDNQLEDVESELRMLKNNVRVPVLDPRRPYNDRFTRDAPQMRQNLKRNLGSDFAPQIDDYSKDVPVVKSPPKKRGPIIDNISRNLDYYNINGRGHHQMNDGQIAAQEAPRPPNVRGDTRSILDVFHSYVKPSGGITQPKSRENDDAVSLPPDIPALKAATVLSLMKIRNKKIIDGLRVGVQCSSCGLRFSVDDKEGYSNHLDMHYFRNSKKGKNSYRWRPFYYPFKTWVDLDESDQSKIKGTDVQVTPETPQQTEYAKPKEFDKDFCHVCDEKLTAEWNEANGEWQYPNCKNVNGLLYHEICYDLNTNVDSN
ncbi:Pre-mRNA cleavage complex 2 protein Pcf11 [Thelohanellus kitauei]|uniref:Pre-mRNA cleavage complex 2 protein Pcf11 n=1 Tax=Thelohanellus kitauei TaxID=669202 RepID=A0A0C2NJU1_THEKT|nr:Pre-mRNA cleavage complex 2 protein Pcf11 [Thelohanellus kitauei]